MKRKESHYLDIGAYMKLIAQLVEHLFCKQKVAGSIPADYSIIAPQTCGFYKKERKPILASAYM